MRAVAWLAITAACGLPESGLGPVDSAITIDVATPSPTRSAKWASKSRWSPSAAPAES